MQFYTQTGLNFSAKKIPIYFCFAKKPSSDDFLHVHDKVSAQRFVASKPK